MQMTLEIPDEQAAKLDRLSLVRHASRETLVSEALNAYLARDVNAPAEDVADNTSSPAIDAEKRKQDFLRFFGALPHLEDGMVFQDRLRNEWVREWDPEYNPNLHG